MRDHLTPWVAVWQLAFLCAVPQGWAQEFEWIRSAGGQGPDSPSGVVTDRGGNAYVALMSHDTVQFGSLKLEGNGIQTTCLARYAPNGEAVWAGRWTKGHIAGMAMDPQDQIVLAGSFFQTGEWTSTAPGPAAPVSLTAIGPREGPDLFLLKVDRLGNAVSAWRYGGGEDETCTGMAVDPEGSILLVGEYRIFTQLGPHLLTGDTSRRLWVAKVNVAGEVVWAREASANGFTGSSTGWGWRIGADAAGNAYLAGVCYGDLILGDQRFPKATNETVHIVKFDRDGRLAWVTRGGGPGGASVWDAIADPAGGVYVSGTLSRAAGSRDWSEGRFGDQDVSGPDDSYLVKLDADGRAVWGLNGGAGLSLGPDGTLFGTRNFMVFRTFGDQTFRATGPSDAFAAHWSSGGKLLWARHISDLGWEYGSALAADPTGNVYVIGVTMHDTAESLLGIERFGQGDVFLARFSVTSPVILEQPQTQTLPLGTNVEFRIRVAGATDPRYQWYKGGTPLRDADRMIGSATDTFTITSLEAADEGEYSARVTFSSGSLLSGVARLRLEGLIQFLGAKKREGEPCRVRFQGQPQRRYDVEYSDNLETWTYLTNGYSGLTGVVALDDWRATNATKRFYRALTP